MIFSKGQLVSILNCSTVIEDKWIGPINNACSKYSIDTILRLSAFIAQVGHESGGLRTVEENLNYSSSGLLTTFGKYFTQADANTYARQPEKIANRAYASRMGNGPEASGDGWKYRGRGLIQCTGKVNYGDCARSIGVNCLAQPELLTTPNFAAMSAGWFWNSRSLNDYADRKDFVGVTKKINGGTIGLAERQALYERAIVVLSGGDPDEGLTEAQKAANRKKRADSVPPATTDPLTSKKTPGAKNTSIGEPTTESESEYPYNAVFQSRSGHVTQVDDTPGKEKLSTMHRTGSYWAINELGTYTHKSVLDSYKITKEDSYEYAGGNYTNQTKGQFFVNSDGDLILKSQTGIFMNAPRVQANTSMFAVSGEVTANQVSTPLLKAQFSDTLAKEAMSAWSLKKGAGGAPIISNSIGFSGTEKTEALRTNDLAYKTPSGADIVTNGIPKTSTNGGDNSSADIGSSVDEQTQAAIDGMGVTTPELENAVKDAASSQLSDEDNPSETPVFLKHVSFDKPTLLSQSTLSDAPNPALYQNNLHTIVDANGKGDLYISDGTQWRLIAGGGSSGDVTQDQINGVIDQINSEVQARIDAINTEASARAQALLSESNIRTQQLQDEATERLKVAQSVLDEASARSSALTIEAQARIDAVSTLGTRIDTETTTLNNTINSLAQRVDTVVAVNGDYVAAIQQEQTARIDGDSSLAQDIEFLTSNTDIAISAVKVLSTTQTVADTSLSERIVSLSANFDTSTATINDTLRVMASTDDALSTRIDTLTVQVGDNLSAAILQESTARATADDSLTRQITTLSSRVDDNVASIQTEVNTRTTLTDAYAGRLDTLDTNVGSNLTAITNEISNRTTADTALGSRIDTLTTRVGNAETSITSETTARTTADTALGTRIDTLTTRVGNNETAISSETTARTTADTALGSRIDTLVTTVNGNTAAITSETTARSTADTALGSRIDTLSTTVNGNTASITTETTARTTADTALGTRIDSLSSQVGTNTASITTESQTRSDAISSLSSQVTSLSTTVGNNTSSITSMSSTVDGVKANYGIKVDNNGYVSGFGLLSEPYNGVVVSSFNILADKFSLVKPGGVSVVPFSVDTTTNPPLINVSGQLRVNGVNIVPNAITASHLSVGSVNAGAITANAITASKIAAGAVTADAISATAIDGMTITGAFIRTAATGTRITLNESASNTIRFYNSSNTVLAQVGGATGNITCISSSSVPGILATMPSASGTFGMISTGGISISQGNAARALDVAGDVKLIGAVTTLDIVPYGANSFDLGNSTYAWGNIYSSTALNVTSDVRSKTDVNDSDLGLNFINTLRPVSYKLIVGQNTLVPGEEVEGPNYPGLGPAKMADTFESSEGVRTHYGLIAQEVKSALGEKDAAFWTLADKNDPDSKQSLRYEELISPMIKAIQELSAKIESQDSIIKDLQNRLGV